MDPLDRADAALARARARGSFVVTPDDAISPMDAASTLQIPRAMVNALDQERPTESTRLRNEGTITGITPVIQPAAPPARPQYRQNPPTQPMPTAGYAAAEQQPMPPAPPAPPALAEEPPTQHTVDGLVPTVTQTGTQRSMLSRRLEGE
ncbi:MAG TPA: hypothetical protein VF444_19320 [Pseudonocardiaceae bacterium]